MSDIKVRQSDTQDVAFIDVLKVITDQTLRQSSDIKGLIAELDSFKLVEQGHDEKSKIELSSLTVFLLGLIAGSLTSVGFVIYVNLSYSKIDKKKDDDATA